MISKELRPLMNSLMTAPPYTYSFSMERALKEGFLSNYKYFPLIVELTENELEEYVEISKKLLKFFDFQKGEFKKDPIVEILFLKRKNIIHKASNKKEAFINILDELVRAKKTKYVFGYIPEGFSENEEGETERLLDQFLKEAHKAYPEIKDEFLHCCRSGSKGNIERLF